MMKNPKRFLVVDSDGCALDAMEVKHRLCFIPATLETWGLQDMAGLVTEAALRINLFSRSRGVNRFLAQSQLFHLLQQALKGREGDPARAVDALDSWIKRTDILSEARLESAFQVAHGRERDSLGQFLVWTREVNRRVAALPCPEPFEGVGAALGKAGRSGIPVYVVSSATRGAIAREWSETGLDRQVAGIFGQEDGAKGHVLHRLLATAGAGAQLLMAGDAIGDWEAARSAGTLFFPILPGSEVESWRVLGGLVLDKFQSGTLDSAYLCDRLESFLDCLPELDRP